MVELRGVTPEDLDTIYIWENDPSLWVFGTGGAQYTLAELYQSLILQSQNLIVDGQLRLMICSDGVAVGALDIFDYNPTQKSAGVGILIDSAHRNQGFAAQVLRSVEPYLANSYGVEQLRSKVSAENHASIRLFRSCGYEFCKSEGEQIFFEKKLKLK